MHSLNRWAKSKREDMPERQETSQEGRGHDSPADDALPLRSHVHLSAGNEQRIATSECQR